MICMCCLVRSYLEDDADFNVEIDDVLSEVSAVSVSNESFKCEQCEKVCNSKRCLARHIKVKHVVVDNTSDSSGFNWMSGKDVTLLKELPIAKLNYIL